MTKPTKPALAAALALTVLSCSVAPPLPKEADLANAGAAIRSDDILRNIKVLASDEFEGRKPGTHGEDMTVDYLVREFKAAGLAPGNPDGSYVHTVPTVGITSATQATLRAGGKTLAMEQPRDFVARSYLRQQEVRVVDSPLVFVGYGIVAPEYGWDDYKGMDLRGKTLVVLVNDPPIPDPNDPSKLDEKMFKGKAMTYYGRWTYKYEMGLKLGAASVLVVHETIPAAYPWTVLTAGAGGEGLDLRSSDPQYPPVPGWLHLDKAKELFTAAGLDFAQMKQRALSRDFRPVELDATITFDIRNRWRDLESRNVVGRIEGSDPALRKELVIYTAHWDHLGWNESLPGMKRDQVHHGALDNASGVAGILSVARAFKALARAPRRSILFIATTGEETGFLGVREYIRAPLYPLSGTLANINIDGINAWGRTRDVTLVGMGRSTVDDVAVAIASRQGRRAHAETRPELGGFYRADHFPFVKAGIPAAYVGRGKDFIGKPAEFDDHIVDTYIAHDYHQVTDTVRDDWDFSGAVEDMQLAFRLGYDIADADTYPTWKPGSEFSRPVR